MKILTNKKSKTYPKDDILSYRVIIVQKDTIKQVFDGYIYDAYCFSGLNEYNQWRLEQQNNVIKEKDIQINNLKIKLDELTTGQALNNESLINDLTQTIVEISTMTI